MPLCLHLHLAVAVAYYYMDCGNKTPVRGHRRDPPFVNRMPGYLGEEIRYN